ncbi:hypothetical protein RhiirA1_448340 [Rhizophagus irregularis]|uniref:Uncharacterized protein n=1 Tax=Rhizophagus irregularis TaxID=588596 RepID=A0A2N0SJQ5_9GLOM|nr:hypothetical protein RhiirA1_448340 [Rhizophagus irregularis]
MQICDNYYKSELSKWNFEGRILKIDRLPGDSEQNFESIESQLEFQFEGLWLLDGILYEILKLLFCRTTTLQILPEQNFEEYGTLDIPGQNFKVLVLQQFLKQLKNFQFSSSHLDGIFNMFWTPLGQNFEEQKAENEFCAPISKNFKGSGYHRTSISKVKEVKRQVQDFHIEDPEFPFNELQSHICNAMDGSEDDLFGQDEKEEEIDKNEREIVDIDSDSADELNEL